MYEQPLRYGVIDWSRASYAVRVRGSLPTSPDTTYLWGSAGITKDITFSKPLLLHIRNDAFGEPVTFGTVASGAQTKEGILRPGECVSIPVQGMSGVYATCELESTVICLIKEST